MLSNWEPSTLLILSSSLSSAGFGRLPLLKGEACALWKRLRCVLCVCVGVCAWSLTGLPVVISNNIVFVLLS